MYYALQLLLITLYQSVTFVLILIRTNIRIYSYQENNTNEYPNMYKYTGRTFQRQFFLPMFYCVDQCVFIVNSVKNSKDTINCQKSFTNDLDPYNDKIRFRSWKSCAELIGLGQGSSWQNLGIIKSCSTNYTLKHDLYPQNVRQWCCWVFLPHLTLEILLIRVPPSELK